MNLNHAVDQLDFIHRQLARSAVFRGYRSRVIGMVGIVALVASAVQAALIPQPDAVVFVQFWSTVAVLVVCGVVMDLVLRCRHDDQLLPHAQTLEALAALAPCLLVGAVLTGTLLQFGPEVAWVLPGMWSVLFSLGAFASRHLLEKAATWIGLFYFTAGTLLLCYGHESPLAPWTMAVSFGLGHLLGAALLYLTLERPASMREGQVQQERMQEGQADGSC